MNGFDLSNEFLQQDMTEIKIKPLHDNTGKSSDKEKKKSKFKFSGKKRLKTKGKTPKANVQGGIDALLG